MMKIEKTIKPLLFAMTFIFINGCEDKNIGEDGFSSVTANAVNINISGETLYMGDELTYSFSLKNPTSYPLDINEVKISVINTNDTNKIIAEKSVASHLKIEPNTTSEIIDAGKILTITDKIPASSFCSIKISLLLKDGIHSIIDGGFFRAIDQYKSLLSYNITKTNYKGLPIYKQIGDMSVGFGVLKSLMYFGGGMAATMEGAPQGGTYPVYATPEFLELSIDKTIKLYNDELGSPTKKVKTVIIGTGVSSVAYFATTMGAVFLPIQFLASANTTKEIRSILDYSNTNGYPSYATLGYDASMPNVGVAWVKLLDLPAQYKKFILDHQVDQVIIYGVGEAALGESWARKVLLDENTTEKGYNAGDLYILYTHYGSATDIKSISARLYDYKNLRLGSGHSISDWESGIISVQSQNIANTITKETQTKAYILTSPTDMIHLYNISSYLILEYMKKNKDKLKAPYVNGIIFNEYITCHPQYETYIGYVPLVYWQFNPAKTTVDRINSYLKPAIIKYFNTPDLLLRFYENMKFYLNSNLYRFNIKNELLAHNAKESNISIRQYSDTWDPTNDNEEVEYLGQVSKKIGSAEEFAYDIINNIGVTKYRESVMSYIPLDINNLKNIVNIMNAGGKINIKLEEY